MLQLVSHLVSILQQLLENILTHHRTQSSIRHFLDKLPYLPRVVTQLVNQLVRINSPVIDSSLYVHGNIVLRYHLLGSQGKNVCLHIHLDHILAHRVYQVETRFQNLQKTTERLMHPHLSSRNHINRRSTAAANARTPYPETPNHVTTTYQARLVSSVLVCLTLNILEILLVTIVHQFVLLGHTILL